jgi:hypothetical protein
VSDQYFAIAPTVEDLKEKIDEYFKAMSAISWDTIIEKSYSYYYGRGEHGTAHALTPSGSQGELTEVMANEYRSFIRHMLTLITAERPAFDVRAMNTDYKSVSQAIVGEQVLEFYLRHKKLENILKSACEKALWAGEGFVGIDWDIQSGEQFGVGPEGDIVMKGDVKYSTYNPFQVIRDPFSSDHNYNWVILVDYTNKFDLAAQFPEAHEDLINDSLKNHGKQLHFGIPQQIKTDKIPVFTFYHRKSPALPQGRWVKFAADKILAEGPLPFEEIPLYRVSAGDVENFVFGYSQAFDNLALQEITDDLLSAAVTNSRNYSRQLIAVARDAGVSHRALTEGSTILELDMEAGGDVGKLVKPLQLTATSPETYNLMDHVVKRMEKFTGINEVIRGEPSPNLRSGNALALIAAQAIKFNSGLQQSYNILLEDVGTATLRFLKQFAKAPRFFRVVGKNNRSMLNQFSSTDLDGVDRVDVQRASALTATTAGRIELADNLLQAQLIKRPEQYISVLESGRLDPLIESERSQLLNIRSENEMLQDGQQPIAIITDNHALHIREHLAVLDDPEARMDQAVRDATLAHVAEHKDLWAQCPIEYLMATQQQPSPVPPMAPQDPMQMEGPGANPAAMEPKAPPQQMKMPKLPNVPENSSPEDAAAFAQLNLPPV